LSEIDNIEANQSVSPELFELTFTSLRFDSIRFMPLLIAIINTHQKVNANQHIGANVRIVGNYASSSNAGNAPHNAAIGWTRQIMSVHSGTNYPIQVGDGTATTGWFRGSSLQLV
jgi:hypothetical protein